MKSMLIHVRLILGLMMALALIALTGCGTLFDGTRQEVRITSQPSGASVFVNNQSFGETPTVVRLKRSSKYTLILEMPGYAPYEITLKRKIPAHFWWRNIPVVGWGIDYVSGSLYELTPGDVNKQFGEAVKADIMPSKPKPSPEPADSANNSQVQPMPRKPVEDSTKSSSILQLSEDTYYVFVVMEPDPTWKKIGQLTPISKSE